MLRPFWAGTAGFDAAGGITLPANTQEVTSVLGTYSESTTDPGQYGTDDFVLLRVFGFLKHVPLGGSNNGQFCVIHAGLTVIDSDRTGGIDETAGAIAIDDPSDVRRWLWSRHWYAGASLVANSLSAVYPNSTDGVLPNGSWVDISPKVRIRGNQRLVLVEKLGVTGGNVDATCLRYDGLRYLLGKQR